MVNKLRKKFVITAMLSLLAILLVMIGVINAINISRTIRQADNLLFMLADNNGYFPGMLDDPNGPVPGNINPPDRPRNPSIPFQFEMLNNNRDAEVPYQARYFWVKFSSDKSITEVNIQHTATVTEDVAKDYATSALSRASQKGFYHTYRYSVVQKEDGSYLVLFLNISSEVLNALTLLLQSVLVGVCALLAMFILVFLFSGKAVAPVVESLEKQKRFITDAGHELKTPLAVISANIDVLEIESGKSEWTESIRNQVKRMTELVKNLLTLSRMDEEKPNIAFNNVDLSQIVKDVSSSFEPVASSNNKTYRVNIEDDIHILGDKNTLTQLTSLLLDNAIKYSSDNGSISVNLTKEKAITLKVSNTCDTIPSGNLDRLFDRFYRADSSRARETGGYGIGLSVARAITASHKGTIEAVREGNDTICFVVNFPVQSVKK